MCFDTSGILEGSPAHAGIDPFRPGSRIARSGFPRPRGDRPREKAGELWMQMVPPPTRG